MVVYFIILRITFYPGQTQNALCPVAVCADWHCTYMPDVIQGWQTSNFLWGGHWRTLSPAQENTSTHAALGVPSNMEVLYACVL